MNVRHERPDPNTTFRVAAPLLVGLADGSVVHVREWSLRAVHAADLAGRDLAGASLSIPFQGVHVFFPVTLVPGPAPGEFLFQNLSGRQREVLGLFYRNLLSGRMAAVGEVITALDTPVDLVPIEETEEERRAATRGQAPRAVRVAAHVAAYVLLAALVFGYLGRLAYERLDGMVLANARVVAEAHTLHAPVAALVGEVLAAEGVEVAAGAPLLRLVAPETRRALDDLALAIARAEALLADAELRLAAHRAVAAAAEGGAEAGAPRAPGEHDLRRRLEDEQRDRARDLRLLEAEAGRLRDALAALELRAPVAGRVAAVAALPGQPVPAGAPLVTVEADRPRAVEGFLPDALADALWPGMRATVRVARDGRVVELPGRVAAVRAEDAAGARGDGAIRLRIALDGLSAEETRALLEAGAPVQARVARGLWRRWLGLPQADG